MPGTSFAVEETTIDGIHAAMLTGELRCSALVETYLQRIDAFDRDGPKLNTIVSLCDQARLRAAELDEELAATGRLSGPLHGIPVLVKDCIETADTPTTFGSIATPGYLARADAEVVRRLAGDRRERAQARLRGGRRAHRPGDPDRLARPGGPHQSGNQYPAVHQPADGRVAPA